MKGENMKPKNEEEQRKHLKPYYKFVPVDVETKQILEKSFMKRNVPRGFWKKVLIDFLNSEETFVELKIEGVELDPRQITPLLSSARNYLKLKNRIRIHLKKGKIYLIKMGNGNNFERASRVLHITMKEGDTR
ncbi:hypothetical protein KEJ27_06330 [Candidatus Bathyarchaeota archaeon]|nr:hypothetical protein [Candidatus Bathyarchaeota archaeon]MBS7613166.1 hypothetical protein [Candidatus Bathyarchaeota archaeon]MBS7617619.1 hypothetical protein [Candidatus Bathyarchaeota archaeon]